MSRFKVILDINMTDEEAVEKSGGVFHKAKDLIRYELSETGSYCVDDITILSEDI